MPRDALPEAPMTGASLLERFQQAKIVQDRNAKLPTQSAFDELAQTLSLFRRVQGTLDGTQDMERYFQRLHDTNRRIRTALEELDVTIPIMQRWLVSVLANPLMGHEGAQANLAWLKNLERVVADVPERPLEGFREAAGARPVRARWHAVVVDLAEAFRIAMRSSNPGMHFGHHDESALVRFLQSIAVPYVTGETATPASIRAYVSPRLSAEGGNKPD